jgi:Holliday junction resolvase RusA-like endonuclease
VTIAIYSSDTFADAAGVIRIVVHGVPGPQGSKTFKGRAQSGKGIMVESSKKVRPWREAVKAAALDKYPDHPLLDTPLSVGFTFYLARPACHFGTGRNAGILKPSAPLWPSATGSTTPDLTKLARSTEDALTDAGIWRDDARVVTYHTLEKRYCSDRLGDLPVPGAIITVYARRGLS